MNLAETTIANVMPTGTASVMAMNVGSLYAPMNSFEFNRVFINEEYFMAKLCQICDKANDVVASLRKCQKRM